MSAAIGAGELQVEEQRPNGSGEDSARAVGSRRATPYLLLLPGMAWLIVFFVLPMLTLLSTSTQTRPTNAEIGVYRQTFRFANYPESIHEYLDVFARSFGYALIATVAALIISYPLAYAIAFVVLWYGILRLLERRGIVLKV